MLIRKECNKPRSERGRWQRRRGLTHSGGPAFGRPLESNVSSGNQEVVPMNIEFKPAPPHISAEYIRLRGLTRENAVSEERLRELGITAASWASDIQSGQLQGIVALSKDEVIGYCFGNSNSGEVVVLAVLPAFEGQGVGRQLLLLVVELLHAHGHTKLFLGCSSDPAVRSYGFYRYLDWRSAGTIDAHGDEVLEFLHPNAFGQQGSAA